MQFDMNLKTVAWLLLLCHTFSGIKCREFPVKSSPGVYKEELPAPILYESVVPIILEYTLPPWNKSEVTFNNWYNCTSEIAPYRYTCPIVYNMNMAVANLHTDFISLQPVKDNVPHTEFYGKLTSGVDFCDSVQKHFSASFVQQSELNSYIQSLEKCQKADGVVHIERDLPDYNLVIRSPFTTMENRFYNTFYTRINGANSQVANGTLDLVASATLSNLRTTIQALMLNHFYAEKNRWTHAVHDCRAQTIPHSIITEEKFRTTLDTISKQTNFMANSQLAISMDLMSKYYSLPLTDCSFTNQTFVTRILVPINKKDAKPEVLKLYKLRPVPFTAKGRVCTIVLKDGNDIVLYDSERELAFKTKCRPNELCQKANKDFELGDHDVCASALLSGKFNDTKRNCFFKCYSYEQARFIEEEGILSRVASDEYVISGQDGTSARVECTSDPGNGLEILFEREETLALRLPCDCTVRLGKDKIYSSHAPCAPELDINRLVPWHFLKDISDKEPDTKVVDGLTAPYENGGTRRLMMKLMGADNGKSEPVEESSHAPLWIFFGLTTLILFLVQLYLIYEVRNVKGSGGGSSQNWLYRARDPDSEARLIDTRGHM